MKKSIRHIPANATSTGRRTTLKALGGLLCVPFASGAYAQQIQPIRFGLQNTFTGASAVVWARQKIYEKRNLKVDAVKFADGRGVRDALLADRIDMGTMNLTPFLSGAAAGSFTLIGIVLLGGDTVGVMARKGIDKISDLKGKNVSITVGSTTGAVFVEQVGPALGLPKGSYRLVNQQPQDQVTGLASGSVDAFAGPEPFLTVAEEQNIGRVLVRFGKYDLLPTCMVAATSFVEKHPDTVVAFLRSWLDGVDYWQKNPKGVVDSLLGMYKEAGYTGLSPAMMEKMAGLPKVVPDITPEMITYVKGQAEILRTAGQLKTMPNWDKSIRTDFLAKART